MVLVRISISAIFFANLAQLVEHLPRKEKVGGSTPLVGIFCVFAYFLKLSKRRYYRILDLS